MQEIIPLDPNLSIYDFEVDLKGKIYKFDIEWNTRSEFWSISLFDSSDNLIAQGVPQTNYPLFMTNTNPNFPDGILWVIDTSGKNQDINRTNFGNEILLVFESL